MSQAKNEQDKEVKQSTSNGSLESQYRDIGISAVAAAAVYTCRSAKQS